MDSETKILFKKPIIPTSWYPLEMFTEFLNWDIKITSNGEESRLIRSTEAIVEQQLKGIYKIFVRLGSPEFVLNRISVVHQSYFRGVSIEIKLTDASHAVIKYTGFEKQHRLIGFSIIGFCELAISWTGK